MYSSKNEQLKIDEQSKESRITKFNYNYPWNCTNIPWQRMDLQSDFESCTEEAFSSGKSGWTDGHNPGVNWSADTADFKLITRIKNNFSVAYQQIWNFSTVLSLDSWILVLNGNHGTFFLSGTVNKVASLPQSGAGLAQGWQHSPFHREHRVPGDSRIQPHNQDGVRWVSSDLWEVLLVNLILPLSQPHKKRWFNSFKSDISWFPFCSVFKTLLPGQTKIRAWKRLIIASTWHHFPTFVSHLSYLLEGLDKCDPMHIRQPLPAKKKDQS